MTENLETTCPVCGYQPRRLIRFPELFQYVKIPRSSLLRMETEGLFPRRLPLSEHTVGWYLDEVQEWVRTRDALRKAATT